MRIAAELDIDLSTAAAFAHCKSPAPGYRTPSTAPALLYSALAHELWGTTTHPLMASPDATGRFSGAALDCPVTACTGISKMLPGAASGAYRNPGAIENIMCLEGALRIAYGPHFSSSIILKRFDMLSLPANIWHRIINHGIGTARFVTILNAVRPVDYSAVFTLDHPARTSAPEEALARLAVRFDTAPGTEIDAAALEARVTRASELVPYKKDLERASGIPVEATTMLTAGSVYPLVVPEGHKGRSRKAPMHGNPGLYMSIAECEPGAEDAPPPHGHSDTQESFFVLEGEWDMISGFDGEVSIPARTGDIVAVPSRMMRTFTNAGAERARLLVIIQGDDQMEDTVSFSSRIGREIERRFGRSTVEALEQVRMTFDAEERYRAAV